MKRKGNHTEPAVKKTNKAALKKFDFSFGEAQEPNPVSTKLDSLNILTNFFANHGFDGAQFLEFATSASCEDTIGCYAKKGFRTRDTFFAVPHSAMVNLNVVFEHPIVKFILQKRFDQGWQHQLSAEQLIWTTLVLLKHDSSPTNNFSAYLNSLSDNSPNILNWDTNLRLVLSETNLQIALEELHHSLTQLVEQMDGLSKSLHIENDIKLSLQLLKYDNLLWAAGHYLSRRYPQHHGPPLQSEYQALLSSLRRESNFGNIGIMVPLLDILNHNHEHDWLEFDVKDGHLHVICNQPVAAGQELFSNYGRLSNGQLLFAYGYAIENNPYDEYLLKLKLPTNASSSTASSNDQGLFALKRGGWDCVPKDLLVALKTMITLSNHHLQKTQSAAQEQEEKEEENEVSDQECLELFYSFLLDKMQRMKGSHPNRMERLRSYGINLHIPFPEADASDPDELIIPQQMTHPTMTIDNNMNVEEREVAKARYIAYYLAGQFEVIMELLVDMSKMFSLPEDEQNGEEGEEDDEVVDDEEDEYDDGDDTGDNQ